MGAKDAPPLDRAKHEPESGRPNGVGYLGVGHTESLKLEAALSWLRRSSTLRYWVLDSEESESRSDTEPKSLETRLFSSSKAAILNYDLRIESRRVKSQLSLWLAPRRVPARRTQSTAGIRSVRCRAFRARRERAKGTMTKPRSPSALCSTPQRAPLRSSAALLVASAGPARECPKLVPPRL